VAGTWQARRGIKAAAWLTCSPPRPSPRCSCTPPRRPRPPLRRHRAPAASGGGAGRCAQPGRSGGAPAHRRRLLARRARDASGTATQCTRRFTRLTAAARRRACLGVRGAHPARAARAAHARPIAVVRHLPHEQRHPPPSARPSQKSSGICAALCACAQSHTHTTRVSPTHQRVACRPEAGSGLPRRHRQLLLLPGALASAGADANPGPLSGTTSPPPGRAFRSSVL
jgi:hypothetical protein